MTLDSSQVKGFSMAMTEDWKYWYFLKDDEVRHNYPNCHQTETSTLLLVCLSQLVVTQNYCCAEQMNWFFKESYQKVVACVE